MTNLIIFSALDIIFSLLFNLLRFTKIILLCYIFFSLIVFKSCGAILSLIENTKLRLALVIQPCATTAVANEAMEIVTLVADKTNKILLKNQALQYNY